MTPWRKKYRPIVEAVAIKHRFDVDDLMKPARNRKLSAARQEAIFEVWNRFGLSLLHLSRMFNCDHTCIIYAIGAHKHRNELEGKYLDYYRKRVERYKVPARHIEAGCRDHSGQTGRSVDRGPGESFGARGVYAP